MAVDELGVDKSLAGCTSLCNDDGDHSPGVVSNETGEYPRSAVIQAVSEVYALPLSLSTEERIREENLSLGGYRHLDN